jgi:hypothetical protein
VGRVGSGPKKVTRRQLCVTPSFCQFIVGLKSGVTIG